MATSDTPADGYPAEIIGYVEPWISSPGTTIDVKVSISMDACYALVYLITLI